MVGGSVRNWLQQREEGPPDLDFEIRHDLPLDKLVALIQAPKVETLPFDIVRLSLQNATIELAPPRREIFSQKPWFKHSEFEADIDPSLSPRQAWSRRDFTVNAIGIDLDGETLVDPFGGVEDLQRKVLRPCGPSFHCDPVRFLRMIRFQCQYGFSLHQDTLSRLEYFNLKGLTPAYFFKESLRATFSLFTARFFETVQQYAIPLPEGLDKLTFLARLNLPEPESAEDVLFALVHGQDPSPLSQLESFSHYAGTSPSLLKQQWNLRNNLERLKNVDEDFLRNALEYLKVEDFLALEEIQLIKKVHQAWCSKAAPHSFYARLKRIHPSLFDTLSFLKDLIPPSEGGGSFPVDLPHDDRSQFRLYRHLKKRWG